MFNTDFSPDRRGGRKGPKSEIELAGFVNVVNDRRAEVIGTVLVNTLRQPKGFCFGLRGHTWQ